MFRSILRMTFMTATTVKPRAMSAATIPAAMASTLDKIAAKRRLTSNVWLTDSHITLEPA